jgi:serine/threonine-protein kinase
MSPEQVRGEPLDARSDIFSFGTILHEMIVGQSPFTRATAAETMAAILKDDPGEALSTRVSPAVERIAARCLEKSRDARFQSARDLSFALELLSSSGSGDSLTRPATGRSISAATLLWVTAATAIAIVAGVVIWRPWAGPATAPESLRLTMNLGAGVPLSAIGVQFGDTVAISRDGSMIAFAAQTGGQSEDQLFVRKLDALTATPLAGTDKPMSPFFSPDGRWLGFFSEGKLKKIAVTGGPAITLADATDARGAWWGDDGRIVFTPHRRPGPGLMRVSENGGDARPLATGEDVAGTQVFPQVLPGGKGVLFTSSRSAGIYNDADLQVQSLDGGPPKRVLSGGFHGRYLDSGHLVFMHSGTLFAVPFDLDRLEVTGPPVPALESVMSNSIIGGAQFSVSSGGRLLYLSGPSVGGALPLHLIDGLGAASALKTPPGNWLDPRFSPDGGKLAMEIRDTGSDIWVLDLARDTFARITTTPALESAPAWTSDGRRLAFGATAEQPGINIYWTAADGSGPIERLTTSAKQQQPSSWHPSGTFLAFDEQAAATDSDVMILPMAGSDAAGWKPGTPMAFANGPGRQTDAMFSPDGKWLAYGSMETGQSEVFVRPFPGPGPRYQVSIGGGSLPVWSRASSELFYGLNGSILVTEFTVAGGAFRSGKPRQWTEERFQFRGANRMYDLHRDGKRIALAPIPKSPPNVGRDSVVMIFNFFEELRRLSRED